MTDEEFLAALEKCDLPPQAFNHEAHVRAAYLYLRGGDFADALARTRRAIRNLAERFAAPDKYHETITVTYVALIQQHIYERGDGGGWAGFLPENSDLLAPNLLRRFYPPGQLESELARKVFLLPRITQRSDPPPELPIEL